MALQLSGNVTEVFKVGADLVGGIDKRCGGGGYSSVF